MANIYFELTREFSRDEPVALLASGRAVVFYRIAMMSTDGDWVIRETQDACDRVRAAREASGRERVVIELAREIDGMQQRDRARVERYLAASTRYLGEFRRVRIDEMPLLEAHQHACALAEQWLPTAPSGVEDDDADAQ